MLQFILASSLVLSSDGFGTAVEFVGDINGDGVVDSAVSDPLLKGKDYTGAVWLISGADRSVLRRIRGHASSSSFGYELVLLGDMNRDGSPDLAVCSGPNKAWGNTYSVSVHSMRDGALIHRYHDIEPHSGTFRPTVIPLADRTGDGQMELAIGWPRRKSESGRVGCLEVYSGKELLHATYGQRKGGRFGVALAELDDMNGDGFSEIAVGSFQRVVVLSGADGEVVAELLAGSDERTLYGGLRVDSSRENLVLTGSVRRGNTHESCLFRYSFDTRTVVATACQSQDQRLGLEVLFVPDLDGDGLDDVLAAAKGGFFSGRLCLFSGESLGPLDSMGGFDGDRDFGATFDVHVSGQGSLEVLVGASGDFRSPGVVRQVTLAEKTKLWEIRRADLSGSEKSE